MKITQMKTNGVTCPIGYEMDTVSVSWKVEETASKKAVEETVEVSLREDFGEILFRTDQTDRTGTILPVALSPKTRYYWRATVKGDAGDSAAAASFFETGRMDTPIDADWIAPEEESAITHPILTKRFVLTAPVKKARLYITGVGLFEAYLNGEKIGDEFLTPYLTDYETRLQVITFDAAEFLKEGENTLSILLGRGWFFGPYGLSNETNYFGSVPAAIAELEVVHEDGTKKSIKTDSTWTYHGSNIESSGIYDGEVINRLLYEGKENPERPVRIIDRFTGGTKNLAKSHLCDRLSLPVRILKTRKAVEILHTPSGATIADFGQNAAGFVSFHAAFPKGTKITFTCGEILQKGEFYHGNYREAKTQFVYVSDGREEEVRAHFTFSGFRYLLVEGWQGELTAGDLTMNVLSSDLARTGHFHCENGKINRLCENTLWGERSNFLDIPSDCPQRSERLGWTGDIQVFSKTAALHLDTDAFFRKFCVQLRDEQKKIDGAVPNYVPNFGHQTDACAVWGDVGTFLPWNLWNTYGSREELKANYPMMRDWVEWIRRQDETPGHAHPHLYDFGFSFGDWLALDGPTPSSFKGRTDEAFISSCHYCRSSQIVSRAAAVLAEGEEDAGKKQAYEKDAVFYEDLAGKILSAIRAEYFTSSGRCSVDTQTGLALALAFDIAPDKEKCREQMRVCLKRDLYQIKAGFAGAPILCMALAESGLVQEAYDLLFREDYPSWLYEVNLGATTVWERWNSVLPDGTINPAGMNSLNHYAYGSVMEFVYSYAGGIRSLAPGWKRAVLAPIPDVRFGKKVTCSYDSPSGVYACSWETAEDGTLSVTVSVPFGCTAEVILPGAPDQKSLEVEAGEQVYRYKPLQDVRQVFTWDSKVSRALSVQKAMEILQRLVPPVAGMAHDPEMAANTFRDLAEMWYLPIDRKKLKEAVAELEKIRA